MARRSVGDELDEIEQALIPFGLHVVGEPMKTEDRHELLMAMAESSGARGVNPDSFVQAIETSDTPALETLLRASMPEADVLFRSRRL